MSAPESPRTNKSKTPTSANAEASHDQVPPPGYEEARGQADGAACEAAPDASRPLPEAVAVSDDRPYLPSVQAIGLRPTREVYNDAVARLYKGLFEAGQAHLIVPAVIVILWLVLTKFRVEPDLPQIDRPHNADMLPEAGSTVVKAVRTVPGAQEMKVDDAALSEELTLREQQQDLKEGIEWAPKLVDLNIKHTETKIAKRVDDGLKRVETRLKFDSWLRDRLDKALAWQKKPLLTAQETRSDHAKLINKLRGPSAQPPAPPVPSPTSPAPVAQPLPAQTPPAAQAPEPPPLPRPLKR